MKTLNIFKKSQNMKNNLLLILLLLCISDSVAQWSAVGNKIKTTWGENLNPKNVHQEYPRPQLQRSQWKNLNGLWEYAITPKGMSKPDTFDGQILVPFAVESSLSGVQKRVGEKKELWYSRTFSVPKNWNSKNIILHFGGVDWKTDVWINDIKIGTHEGGYAPFSFDISPYLKQSKTQKLTVKVWDPTDSGYQARGKQVNKPRGIWYTPVTGIWQTVWIEPVSKRHLRTLHTTPNIDENTIRVQGYFSGTTKGDYFQATVKDGNTTIASAKSAVEIPMEIEVPNSKHWHPDSPFLYGLEINLVSGGKVVDSVKSYFAMRKIAKKRDAKGIIRLQLNNKDYFQFGTLDQGWWPDGLYTAPSDEALKFDILKTKELGFNMIRKHVKVEPARWYYHTDKIGMLVWQDMPNGDWEGNWQMHQYFDGQESIRTPESEKNFRQEWKAIIDYLYAHPSIVCWVPFNEAWGQFKTQEITTWTKSYDPSRLVNSASGGNHFVGVGDILDLHNYPEPKMYLFDESRANVLGEYGGIGLAIKNHLWQPDRNWGYVQYKTSKEATDQYVNFATELYKRISSGFSAAIYTQTTDVEIEVNGLMTYDRKMIKLELYRVQKINQQISNALSQ